MLATAQNVCVSNMLGCRGVVVEVGGGGGRCVGVGGRCCGGAGEYLYASPSVVCRFFRVAGKEFSCDVWEFRGVGYEQIRVF